MNTLTSTPGALRVLTISIIARLPLAMLGIVLLVHAVHLTGSYSAAGIVAGANAIATGVGGPLLGKLVDRRGQTLVLIVSGCVSGALLCVIGTLPVGTPLPLLIAVAFAIGAALPPVGACLRSLLPSLAPDAHSARAIYAVEASAVELTWVVGPPVALALAVLFSTGVAVAIAGVVLAVGASAFALQGASRTWRPRSAGLRGCGALRAPAVQTLVLVFAGIGVLVGAVEVGAASAASSLGSSAGGGILLGIWSVGSLAGGVATARLGGGVRSAVGLALVLAALACGHVLAVIASGDMLTLAIALLVAGGALAPTFASAYAMVDRAAPAGAVTEAFAWLATALAVGGAAGSAAAGVLVDHSGPSAAFGLAAAAGVASALVTMLRAQTIDADDVVPVAHAAIA
ncbi:MAG TPA: MFS transporter [Gaiellales bacterium]